MTTFSVHTIHGRGARLTYTQIMQSFFLFFPSASFSSLCATCFCNRKLFRAFFINFGKGRFTTPPSSRFHAQFLATTRGA